MAKAPTPHDPEPKALACSSLRRADPEQSWRRFVAGRPVAALTPQCLAWSCPQVQREGKRAWLVVGDKASWPLRRAVRQGGRPPNQKAQRMGGVRLVR